MFSEHTKKPHTVAQQCRLNAVTVEQYLTLRDSRRIPFI